MLFLVVLAVMVVTTTAMVVLEGMPLEVRLKTSLLVH